MVPFLGLTSVFSQLLSLGGRGSVAVARVVMGLQTLTPVDCSLSLGPSIDMLRVQSMVEEMGASLSPGAQSLMNMVQFQQKVGSALTSKHHSHQYQSIEASVENYAVRNYTGDTGSIVLYCSFFYPPRWLLDSEKLKTSEQRTPKTIAVLYGKSSSLVFFSRTKLTH